jgi:hypothetical protein
MPNNRTPPVPRGSQVVDQACLDELAFTGLQKVEVEAVPLLRLSEHGSVDLAVGRLASDVAVPRLDAPVPGESPALSQVLSDAHVSYGVVGGEHIHARPMRCPGNPELAERTVTVRVP